MKKEELLMKLREELSVATDEKEIDMLQDAIQDLEYEPMNERYLKGDM